MRLIDALNSVLIVGCVSAGWWLAGAERRGDEQLESVRDNVEQLELAIRAHRLVDLALHEPTEFPGSVDPNWFPAGVPENDLLDGSRPWIDVAGPEQARRSHPVDKVAGPNSARFWYNPRRGIVRARVPSDAAEPDAIEIYNRINGTDIEGLFADPPDVVYGRPESP